MKIKIVVNNFVIPQKKISYLILIVFLTLLTGLIEIISLGAIPVFISILLDLNQFITRISNYINLNFLLNYNHNTIILLSSLILLFLYFLKTVFVTLVYYMQYIFLKDISYILGKEIFNNYLFKSFDFYLDKNSAYLTRNISEEIRRAVNYIFLILNILKEILILIFIIFLLIFINFKITISIMFFLVLISSLFYFFFRNKIIILGKESQNFTAKVFKIINHGIGSIKETKIANKETFFVDLFKKQYYGREKNNFFIQFLNTTPRVLLEFMAIAVIVFIVFYFIFTGYSVNEYIPILTFMVVSLARMIPAFSVITSSLSRMRFLKPSHELILNEYKNISKDEKFEQFRQSKYIDVNLNNEIKIKNLTFYYKNKNLIFKNLDLKIIKNSFIAIVGPSGSGKSTLVNLILGLIKPINGSIECDNQNIHKNIQSWQKNIGYIPQDIFLLDDSIKNNIAFGISDQNIDVGKINNLLKICKLDKFVSNLPNGINHKIGERGIKLSGGQKQRIGIARALYREPKIIILDEATSALDLETENDFMNSINYLKQKYTIIMITHRIKTIEKCDKIFFINNFSVNSGSYSELKSKNPNFFKFS